MKFSCLIIVLSANITILCTFTHSNSVVPNFCPNYLRDSFEDQRANTSQQWQEIQPRMVRKQCSLLRSKLGTRKVMKFSFLHIFSTCLDKTVSDLTLCWF